MMRPVEVADLDGAEPQSRRLNVVFLPHPYRSDLFEPFGRDVVAELGDRHQLSIYDLSRPAHGQLEQADVVIDHGGQARTREMADACASIKLWQILGTGFDEFDLAYWKGRGITVANTPGSYSADSVAEGALMLMLMLSRRYPESIEALRQGIMYEPVGIDLGGRTLGMVGFGASARALARRARALNMRLLATELQQVEAAEAEEFGLEWIGTPEQLPEMLPKCDFVSLHLHLNQQTRRIIDDGTLRHMRPTAFLVNVARGALVDEDALEKALADHRIAGAGLDVFGEEPPDLSRPLFHMPNVVYTPHVVANTDGTSRRRAECVGLNVARVASGQPPLYQL